MYPAYAECIDYIFGTIKLGIYIALACVLLFSDKSEVTILKDVS